MTLAERTPITAAEIQEIEFNHQRPGSNVVTKTFPNIPSGQSWAVVGCLLDAATTKAEVDGALVTAIEGIAQVQAVGDDRFYWDTPATIEIANRQFDLLCTYSLSGDKDFGTQGVQKHSEKGGGKRTNVPVNSAMAVYMLRLTTELNEAGIAALESAIVSASAGKITNAEVVLTSAVPSNVTNASMNLEVRYKLDPIPAG